MQFVLEYLVFHFLSKIIKTKTYGTISLHIVLCWLSYHTPQLLKLHNYIALHNKSHLVVLETLIASI